MTYHFAKAVIFEDNHLLVVAKPPGIATMGLPEGETTLLTLAKEYVKERYNKPGNVYLGVVSRLDFPVSGVIVFARNSKAAARLNEQFRDRDADKKYHALVDGTVTPKEATLSNHLCEDPRHRKMWVTARSTPDSKLAVLSYRCLKYIGHHSHLEIKLETGRKHQIRLQLSHHGYPILGDIKYGSRVAFGEGIALHALQLAVKHPITGEVMTFEAPLPEHWKRYLKND